MAYTIINKSSDYFNTKLYSGNSSTQSITGVGFQPDWVWCKSRSGADNHAIFDAVRGGQKQLRSNTNDAELTRTNAISSFDSDGWSMGSQPEMNSNGVTFASWNWLANGAGSANTDGTISSTVSANTTSGFSIVSYTGTGANATVGHGLGSVPYMIIIKELNPATTRNWRVYHNAMGNGKLLYLDTTASQVSDSLAWNGDPTSSIFTLGNSGGVNGNGKNFIAYCFAEKQGYSKFGSYTGNGNADGTFVYTGFKPAFIMIKNANNGSEAWEIFDTKRDTFNTSYKGLFPNANSAELTNTAQNIDILSNGFKPRSAETRFNGSGNTIIYMAFAEAPLVGTNNVPANAR